MTREKDFTQEVLKRIVMQAIQEGKLYELLFTEEGKRLWHNTVTNKEEMAKLVRKSLKKIRR